MSSQVTVAVRVRPFLPRELLEEEGDPLAGVEVAVCGVDGSNTSTHITLQ
jgi:hypothetical protein